jgi:hypothetical protein
MKLKPRLFAVAPSPQPTPPPGAREPLPLPLAGEGWGRSRGFEPHAASLLSEAGMQAGLRTAGEGLRFVRRGSREAPWSH